MTDVYIYCDECKKDVKVMKMELDDFSIYHTEVTLTLECGHKHPHRLRYEKET
jgi:uncharacterized Zn finger protein